MDHRDERPGAGHRSGRRRTGPLLLLTLAVVGAACRGGPGSDEPRGAAPPASDAVAFCDSARDLLGRLGAAVDPGRPPDEDPRAAIYRELTSFLDAVARSGPHEIQADAASAASVTKEYYEALQRAAFVPSGVPPEISAKLQSEEYAAGIGRVADYARSTCGLGG